MGRERWSWRGAVASPWKMVLRFTKSRREREEEGGRGMTGKELKAVLEEGGRVYGTMVCLTRNPRWARVLGGLGFDYVIVDTEHSAFSRGEVADIAAMLQQAGVAPIVRVPTPDPHYVTMAMDAGAHGVLAPYCESVEQVRGVVGGAKWRP